MPIMILRGKPYVSISSEIFQNDDWKEVSERIVLEKRVDEFGRVTLFLDKMVQGQEIDLTHCIFRMKNSVTNKNGYLASLSIISKTPKDDN